MRNLFIREMLQFSRYFHFDIRLFSRQISTVVASFSSTLPSLEQKCERERLRSEKLKERLEQSLKDNKMLLSDIKKVFSAAIQ